MIDNRVLIGGVAVCAAVATFHGAAHAASTSGVVSPIDLLYPVMGDGLALVAWRQTQDPAGRLRGFAWCVMVLAASASGLAQAYVLAVGKQGGSAVLAAGMGAAPAVCVLLATVLASGSPQAQAVPHEPESEADDDAEPKVFRPVIPERPEGGEAAVYRLYDVDDRLLYVGCTARPTERLREHRRQRPWWGEVDDADVIWYQSVERAADAEREVINAERPLYNSGLARYSWSVAAEPVSEPDAVDEPEAVAAPEPEPRDDLKDRRRTVRPESRTYVCKAGCGREVSRATYTRHKSKGCPAAAA